MAEQDGFMKKILEFAEKIKFIEKVYKEDKNGEYVVVSAEQLENINRTIEEFNKMLDELKQQIDIEHREMVSGIEKIFSGLDFKSGKLDIDQVNKIFQEAVEKINKTKRINVSPALQTDKNGNPLKGGEIHVAHVFEGDEQEKGGGAIMQGKNNEYQIEGEYANIEKTVEILWDAARKIDNLQVKDTPDLTATKENVKRRVGQGFSSLRKEANKVQKGLRTITGISKFVGKYIPGRNLKIAAFAAILGVHAVAALTGGAEYSVAGIEKLEENEVNSEDEIDKILEEIQNVIDQGANGETIKESNIVNGEGKTQDNIDEEVSNTKNERNEQLNKCKDEMQKIIDEYNAISNPTNEQYLNYLLKLSSVKQESLELMKTILGEDIAYYQEFIRLNEEHIAKSSALWDQDTTDRHYSEIGNTEDKIKKANEKITQVEAEMIETGEKNEFLQDLTRAFRDRRGKKHWRCI